MPAPLVLAVVGLLLGVSSSVVPVFSHAQRTPSTSSSVAGPWVSCSETKRAQITRCLDELWCRREDGTLCTLGCYAQTLQCIVESGCPQAAEECADALAADRDTCSGPMFRCDGSISSSSPPTVTCDQEHGLRCYRALSLVLPPLYSSSTVGESTGVDEIVVPLTIAIVLLGLALLVVAVFARGLATQLEKERRGYRNPRHAYQQSAVGREGEEEHTVAGPAPGVVGSSSQQQHRRVTSPELCFETTESFRRFSNSGSTLAPAPAHLGVATGDEKRLSTSAVSLSMLSHPGVTHDDDLEEPEEESQGDVDVESI